MHPGNRRCSEVEMTRGSPYSRAIHMVTSAASAVGMMGWERSDGDPDGLRFLARTFVWARWLILAFGLMVWVYRSVDWLETFPPYLPGLLLLVGLNGYTHYRLATEKAVTRGWILLNATLDVFILSGAVAIGGGFSQQYLHLLYYPQLAGYAVVLTSFRLTMALRDLCGRSVSGNQPGHWGQHRHCGGRGEDPARPDSRHVYGGRNRQRHRQVRANEVEAVRRARARAAA